jgi:hypothetical protein
LFEKLAKDLHGDVAFSLSNLNYYGNYGIFNFGEFSAARVQKSNGQGARCLFLFRLTSNHRLQTSFILFSEDAVV